MKKLCLSFILFFLYFLGYSQEIKLNKEFFINQFSTDSMHYMDRQKIIPFKDSGVITAGYADSVIAGGPIRTRVVIRSFSKDLDSLWTLKLPFKSVFSTLSICTDKNFNIYLTYDNANSFNMVKIDAAGKLIYNYDVTSQIALSTVIINNAKYYNNYIAINGSIYISQAQFMPFIALLYPDGSLKKKYIFPASASLSGAGLYNCSNLTLTKENNLAFTFQLDTKDNYKIYCFDSTLSEVWNKTLNMTLGFNSNLLSQGGNITFVNFDDNGTYVDFYKYDSKTGSGGTKVDRSYSFTNVFNMFTLPCKNGNFLTFGNYTTGAGFDNAIDYFDMNQVLTNVKSNTFNSRNRVSDACIIGNNIYTIAIRFADRYCISSSGIYRGNLWLKKFTTNFLTQDLGVVQNRSIEGELNVYPNPFSDEISITTDTENISFSLINELGETIQVPYHFKGRLIVIETNQLNTGMYILRISNIESGVTSFRKIAKVN